jgi:hypothetical protein
LAFVLFFSSGVLLTACGGSSSTAGSGKPASPSAPSYDTVLANVEYQSCLYVNNSFSELGTFMSPQGPITQCSSANPMGQYPAFANLTASCAYDLSKVVIGYKFNCQVDSPHIYNVSTDSGWVECIDSTSTNWEIQMQTPQSGKWHFYFDNLSNNQSNGFTSELSPISSIVSGNTSSSMFQTQQPMGC